jgi:hypothetical protein
LKQKSSEYLQSTLVFTKEREEVEKIAAAEAQREAEKTIAPLSRNASNESTYQPFRQGFRPMDIFFTTYRNFFITGVSQLLQLRLTGSYLSIFKFGSAIKRQKISATAPECCLQAHPCPKRMQHR